MKLCLITFYTHGLTISVCDCRGCIKETGEENLLSACTLRIFIEAPLSGSCLTSSAVYFCCTAFSVQKNHHYTKALIVCLRLLCKKNIL